MLIVDDGTGAIGVSADKLYDMEQVLRVIGIPYKEGGQIIVDSEIIQDFSDFNLELFKKSKRLRRRYTLEKRMPSSRLSLAEIHKGYFVKPEGDFATNYVITQEGLKIYRLKGVATIMAEPRLSEDGTFGSVLLDDGTQSIISLAFRENTKLLMSIKKGDIVQFIAKLSEWQGKNSLILKHFH